ncbi:MAG: MarR family transcriptional regulator [Candidatus Binatia bacterium]|jgi:MarR family transcriptional regulator, transcriptional regulator for hemolysin
MLKSDMEVEEHIGLLIAAARRRIKQAVGSRVRGYDLTTQQFWVLVAIYEHPGFSLGELAAHIRMDTPTASRVVFALMNRKLVEVRDDAEDRRRARLHLKPAGAALAKALHALATATRAALVQGLSAAEQAALRISLRKIIANMDRLQDGDATESPAQAHHR